MIHANYDMGHVLLCLDKSGANCSRDKKLSGKYLPVLLAKKDRGIARGGVGGASLLLVSVYLNVMSLADPKTPPFDRCVTVSRQQCVTTAGVASHGGLWRLGCVGVCLGPILMIMHSESRTIH